MISSSVLQSFSLIYEASMIAGCYVHGSHDQNVLQGETARCDVPHNRLTWL
jgi:hypothetical protein